MGGEKGEVKRRMYLMGIDVGTSAAKCLLVDEKGRVAARAAREYPLETPRPGWAEQEPARWREAVFACIREVLDAPGVTAGQIGGVSFSGQMHGLVAMDGGGRVLRKAILWCDQRTQCQCEAIERAAGGREALLSMTNNVMLTGYTGGKLLWLREMEPERFKAMTVFLCPKDYVRWCLTGVLRMDVSEASGTGFFDTKNRRWHDGLIERVSLPRGIFPETVEAVSEAGRVTKEAAQETGLLPGTPCFAGGGDAVVQSFGSGLLREGAVGTVIGTAGNVSMGFEGFRDNPGGQLQMFCGVTPGAYMSFGATQTAGGALRWFRDELLPDLKREAERTGQNVYNLINRLAAQSPPGARGVVFAPYLSGERCPYPDPDARGVLYGLSLHTKREDVVRAVMEGIVFSLGQIVDIYRSFAGVERAVASGGGAASGVFLQMQADAFDLPVTTVSAAAAGGAYGAALLAGLGLGWFRTPEEALSLLKTEKTFRPIPDHVRACRKTYAVYRRLYPALREVFRAGAALSEEE